VPCHFPPQPPGFPLHERLEADQSGNAAATLAHWQNTLATALHLDASALANAHGAPALARSTWTLVQRQHLNPGSQGGAVFHLELATQAPNTTWESGDLVDLLPPLATEAQEPPAPRSSR
jgi:sulfite reductase (NADPH) flavoprotein alpha-component